MKKLVLAIILIFSLSFFVGCQKQEKINISDNFIMVSLEQASNGGMVQSIRFSLNETMIKDISASLQEEVNFRRNLIKQVENIRNEFLFGYALKYVSNPIDEYKINQGVILTDVSYQSSGDFVGFEVVFTSSGAWNYYNFSEKTDDEISQSKKYNGNIFMKKIVNKGIFPFSAQVKTEKGQQMVGEIYKERYLSAAKGLSFEKKLGEIYDCQFIYNYGTMSQKLKSDAKLQYYGNDKKYHHVWIVDDDELKTDNTMTLSITQINKGWWIFFALLIPVFTSAVTIIIIKFKNRNVKSKKK